jgi:chitodextrinase
VDLSWTASTDDVGVAGYAIFRNGTQIDTTTTTSYSDTTVQASTSYSYTVTAYDAAGNTSPASNAATVTTPAAADTTPPTAPTNLTATASSATRVDLGWTASTDDVGVTGYQIFRGGTQIGTSTTTSYSDTTVKASTSYSYTVEASDAAGNTSGDSNTATVTTPAAVTQTLTFTPTDDAMIESDTPSTNYGTATTFTADASPIRNILVKFTVSGVGTGTVVSAKLRLHCVDGSTGGGGDFYPTVSNSWSETTVNWGNAPAAGATKVASLGPVATSANYDVDVSPLVTGDGLYSFVLAQTSSDGVDMSSREATSLKPELVVTFG